MLVLIDEGSLMLSLGLTNRKKGNIAVSFCLLVFVFLLCFIIGFSSIISEKNASNEAANAATGITVSQNTSLGNVFDVWPSSYGNVGSSMTFNLTDYLGSSSLNNTVKNAFGNLVNNGGDNSPGMTISDYSNGVTVSYGTSLHTTSGYVYGTINVRLPVGVKDMAKAGLVTGISVSYVAKNNNDDNHQYAIGMEYSNSPIAAVRDGSKTGSATTLSDTGATTTLSTSGASPAYNGNASCYEYVTIHTYLRVDGVIWPGDRKINFSLYDFKVTVNYSFAPSIRLGTGYPKTTGSAGKWDTIKNYVAYSYNGSSVPYLNMTNFTASSGWTTLDYKYNNRSSAATSGSDDTGIYNFYLGKATLSSGAGYTGSNWYYTTSAPSLNGSATAAGTSSYSVLEITLTNLRTTYGNGCYFFVNYNPKSYTLTLSESSSAKSFTTANVTGWTLSGSTIYRTVYFDNDFNLPLANSIFLPTGGFSLWTETVGPSVNQTYGDGGTIAGTHFTQNITLAAAFASYSCKNPTTGSKYYDIYAYNSSTYPTVSITTSTGLATANAATFAVALGAEEDTHYGIATITYDSFSGNYGVHQSGQTYTLNSVHIVYYSGPLAGVTVEATMQSSLVYRVNYLSGDFYVYSSWSISRTEYTLNFYYGSGSVNSSGTASTYTLQTSLKYSQGSYIDYSWFPTPSNMSIGDYIFAGWYTTSSGGSLIMQRATTDTWTHTALYARYAYSKASATGLGDSMTTTSDGTGTRPVKQANITVPSLLQPLTNRSSNYGYTVQATITGSSYNTARITASGGHTTTYTATSSGNIKYSLNGGSDAGTLATLNSITASLGWSAWGSGDSGVKTASTVYVNSTIGLSGSSNITYLTVKGYWGYNVYRGDKGTAYLTWVPSTMSLTFAVSRSTSSYNTVTYNSNDGNSYTRTFYKATSGTFTLPRACYWTRTGYYFLGWSTTSSGSIATTGVATTQTYYAIWKLSSYQLNSWDVYFGDSSTASYVALVRAPTFWDYASSGSITLSTLNTSPGGTNSNYLDSATKDNPQTGFAINGWYTTMACTGSAVTTVARNTTSPVLRFLKHTLNDSVAALAYSGADTITTTYGDAVYLDDTITITKPNTNSTYEINWKLNGATVSFLFDEDPYIHAIFDCDKSNFYIADSNLYAPTLTTRYEISGGVSVGNRTLVSVEASSVVIKPVIIPIKLEANILNNTRYVNSSKDSSPKRFSAIVKTIYGRTYPLSIGE